MSWDFSLLGFCHTVEQVQGWTSVQLKVLCVSHVVKIPAIASQRPSFARGSGPRDRDEIGCSGRVRVPEGLKLVLDLHLVNRVRQQVMWKSDEPRVVTSVVQHPQPRHTGMKSRDGTRGSCVAATCQSSAILISPYFLDKAPEACNVIAKPSQSDRSIPSPIPPCVILYCNIQ